jgi:broad specificity phosphatase PhoE
MMKSALLAAALLVTAALPATAQSTVVVLVRHAETTAGPAGDPVLSGVGEQRAHALALALAGADVAAVFTTQYARTGGTAEPTATAAGAERHVVQARREARADHIREIAERIRRDYAGRTVLVVGHSNTLPQIIEALGGPVVAPIADTEHDRLYVVTLDERGVRLVASRYGS